MNIDTIVILLIVVLILYSITKKVKRPLSNKDISILKRRISKMTPNEFEHFCAKIFNLLGMKAHVTSASRDGGKDVILNGTTYIECKHWKGKVGRPVGQKLCGAMYADGIRKGYIITTGTYTKDCLEYCKKVNIICYDTKDIIRLCQRIGKRILH